MEDDKPLGVITNTISCDKKYKTPLRFYDWHSWADVLCAWINDAKSVDQIHKFADANKRSINLAKKESLTSYESVIDKLRSKKKELS